MVIDTSALIAILLKETEAEKFAKAILHDSKRLLSAFSALETSVVIFLVTEFLLIFEGVKIPK
jgi:uncharacterized protein with PIN domain